MRQAITYIVGSLCAFIPCLCLATHSQSSSLMDLSLEELLKMKVSSATLTPVDFKKAPASISILTRSQLAVLPYRYLHEVINLIPGYQSFRQGEAADEYYHSVRGRRVGASSREVLILVDGVRFNRESDNATAVPSLPLDNIDRIEFIRGPGSAIYGSNAFMGVISITTKIEQNKLSIGATDQDLTNASGAYRLDSDILSIELYGYAEHDKGEDLTLESNFMHNPVASNDPSKKADLQLKLSHNDFSLEMAKHHREAENYYAIEYLDDRNRTQNDFTYIKAKQAFSLSPHWNLDLQINHSVARYRLNTTVLPEGFVTDLGGSIPPSNEEFKVNVNQHEEVTTFAFLNNFTLNESHSIQLGGEYRKAIFEPLTRAVNYDLSTIPATFVGDSFSVSSHIAEGGELQVRGVFVQYQGQVLDNLDLVLGARTDNYSLQKEVYSPRFALTWTATPSQTVKLLYGEAFRSPTINEKNVARNTSLVGNPDIEAETVKTLELNWLLDFENKNLLLSAFDGIVENAIEQTYQGTTRTFENSTDEEHFRGIEIEGNLALSHAWRASFNASHLLDYPDTYFRQAKNMASVSINFTSQPWAWNLSAQYAGQRSMQVGDTLKQLDAYPNLATSISYAITANQSIDLKVTNVTDENYRTPTQGKTLYSGLPNRGAEAYLRYTRVFD